MKRSIPILALAALLAAPLTAVPAVAEDCPATPEYGADGPVVIAQYGLWKAYILGEGQKRYCYVAARPPGGDASMALLVWHAPFWRQYDVIQVDLARTADARPLGLTVDGRRWPLYAASCTAWSFGRDQSTIAGALMSGRAAAVTEAYPDEPVAPDGPDLYPLEGFREAYAAMDAECKQVSGLPAGGVAQ
ncbi:MAG: hypothetical protein AB7N54_17275 [Alphaproteobacteria bacterium]